MNELDQGIREGKYPESTFKLPAGIYPGELFCVLEGERIVAMFAWDGARWRRDDEVMEVSK